MSSHHHKNRHHECCDQDSCCDTKKSCGCSSSGCCSSCQCGCQEKCTDKCHEHSCGDTCHHHDSESCSETCKEFAGQLLEMADQAWLDVLHSKIEEQIERHCGGQLEEIARVVSCANKARWKHKMAAKKGCSEYTAALAHIFHKE